MTGSGAEGRTLSGRSLHAGTGSGDLLCLAEPLSIFGGVDAAGVLVDPHHPQRGARLSGRVVAMASGRGSSSSSAVLAELVRTGRAPAAILLAECDTILVVGALVAAEMYARLLPVVELAPADLASLASDTPAAVWAGPAAGPATLTLRADTAEPAVVDPEAR